MTGRVGQYRGDEYWIRCPFCGDSQNDPNKAHFSVNITTGQYYCHRCKVGGILPPKKRASLINLSEATPLEQELIDYDDLIPGPASQRKSLLPRFHYRSIDELFDAFEMFDPLTQQPSGYHLRGIYDKKSFSYGSGIAWPAGHKLLSSETTPLRLVEGPYDVLYQEDVCCFGLVSSRKILDRLKGHFVVLCPDGDIWVNPELLKGFLRFLKIYQGPCTILAIEYLPDGKDPDEVPIQLREQKSISEIFKITKGVIV